ncbi:hypothetical protein Z043_101070 [Scleropages formosus]|uniref:Williams-Beuren syndrome chromosomal region 16 protein-like n=1 Tax=Scleropages formosus TaxID=113540 RepID=A0A0P7VBU2_SCLFO|nr:hypothetical protein Z043_101070 [Scleropages formosus]
MLVFAAVALSPLRALCEQRVERVASGGRRWLSRSSAPKHPKEELRGGPVFQYAGRRHRPKHKVFVWGFSYAGALGIPSFVLPDSGRKKCRKHQYTPYRLETEHQISSAACGYGFTLLSSKTLDVTKVWGMGLNKDSQLGFQVSRHDRLFSLGNNAYGQCGRKIVEEEIYSGSHVIHKIEGFDSPVTQVACGQDHSLFLTERGQVYACGWGADGQTGLGHYNMTSHPVAVGGDLTGLRVQQVSSYGDLSLAVSQDGSLFGWGNSEYLQLSAVTEDLQLSTPRHLPLEGVGKLQQAACGGTQVAVLNDKGEVFVWGYGILGKGPNLSEAKTPEMIPLTLFGRSEFNPSVRVAQIRCGLHHFAAVTDRGELFVWGKNVRGCLGIGKPDDQFFPWRVTVPGHVLDVACGVDHMVALVKSLT